MARLIIVYETATGRQKSRSVWKAGVTTAQPWLDSLAANGLAFVDVDNVTDDDVKEALVNTGTVTPNSSVTYDVANFPKQKKAVVTVGATVTGGAQAQVRVQILENGGTPTSDTTDVTLRMRRGDTVVETPLTVTDGDQTFSVAIPAKDTDNTLLFAALVAGHVVKSVKTEVV
jgi:hypothetical protein